MPEQGEHDPLNKDLIVQFSELLKVLPQSGIAYRGDMSLRTIDIQRDGLTDPDSNYIVFLPPKSQDTASGRRPEDLFAGLQEGVEFALIYADIMGSPAESIHNLDFVDFKTYYTVHPEKLYALSWFTAPTEDQFSKVEQNGSKWHGLHAVNAAGNVRRFGEIPSSFVHSSIIAELSDIDTAQTAVYQKLSSRNVVPKTLNGYFGRLGRWDFHKEISKVMTRKFVHTMITELSGTGKGSR